MSGYETLTANDETMARAFRARPGLATARSCPDPETLWDAVAGQLDAERRRAIIDHTATCGACAEDWRMATAIDDAGESLQALQLANWSGDRSEGSSRRGADRMGPPVKFVPGGRFSTRVSVLAGVAATCLLAVAIYSRQTRPEPPTAPIYRSAAPTSSAAQLYSFTDATFTWPAGQPGDRYQLLVNGRDFRPIASIEVDAATSYSAGAQLAEALSSSGGFYWQIQTTAPDGRQSSSATMRVDMLQAPDPKLAPEQ